MNNPAKERIEISLKEFREHLNRELLTQKEDGQVIYSEFRIVEGTFEFENLIFNFQKGNYKFQQKNPKELETCLRLYGTYLGYGTLLHNYYFVCKEDKYYKTVNKRNKIKTLVIVVNNGNNKIMYYEFKFK